MLPAAGQGIIGIECMQSRNELRDLLAELEHAETRMRIVAERAVATTLGANCQSPVASFASITGGALSIDALVASTDGKRIIREQSSGSSSDAQSIGQEVARQMLQRGAAGLLAEAQS